MPTSDIDLRIEVNPFGHELDIYWNNEVLTATEKVYLFRRSGTNVTDQEITDYFTNINNLTNYNYNGLMVFDSLLDSNTALGDFEVRNGTVYYYKAAVRDSVSGLFSFAGAVNGTPNSLLKVNVKDGKEIVKTAIEKMLENIVDRDGRKVTLHKNIKVVKHFSIEPISDNYIMVERINGSNFMQFWSQKYNENANSIFQGDTDVDVIRATFITTESTDRRDKVADIFRGNKSFLRAMIRKLGAQDSTITIEGDYYNPQIHGVNAQGFMVIFNLLIENISMHPKTEINALTASLIITDD